MSICSEALAVCSAGAVWQPIEMQEFMSSCHEHRASHQRFIDASVRMTTRKASAPPRITCASSGKMIAAAESGLTSSKYRACRNVSTEIKSHGQNIIPLTENRKVGSHNVGS